MRKRLTAVALAGTVGLGAVGAVAYPAFAETTNEVPDPPTFQQQRTDRIKEALKGLVDDKTLTQEQADKVAQALSRSGAGRFGPGAGPDGPGIPGPGRGMHGGGLLGVEGAQADEAAAKVLGLSVEELRAAVRDGSTLADLAEKQGKDVDALVTALVTAARAQLDESVEAGRINQKTADRIKDTLEQRVRSVVRNGRPEPGLHFYRHLRKGSQQDGTPPGEPGGPGTPPGGPGGSGGPGGLGGHGDAPAPSASPTRVDPSFFSPA